jgi:transcriptional regulator GlxA family with amidase domain
MTLEGWMAEHLHLPLGIDELASYVGLSPRAVQLAFRQHRGVTPLEFLRTLRLDEARKRLASGTALSVAEVAESLGFTHLGRFTGNYKQRFGETPAQTLRNHAGP